MMKKMVGHRLVIKGLKKNGKIDEHDDRTGTSVFSKRVGPRLVFLVGNEHAYFLCTSRSIL